MRPRIRIRGRVARRMTWRREEADADGDTHVEGIEDGGEDDDEHQTQLRPCPDAQEEGDIVRAFFDEGQSPQR